MRWRDGWRLIFAFAVATAVLSIAANAQPESCPDLFSILNANSLSGMCFLCHRYDPHLFYNELGMVVRPEGDTRLMKLFGEPWSGNLAQDRGVSLFTSTDTVHEETVEKILRAYRKIAGAADTAVNENIESHLPISRQSYALTWKTGGTEPLSMLRLFDGTASLNRSSSELPLEVEARLNGVKLKSVAEAKAKGVPVFEIGKAFIDDGALAPDKLNSRIALESWLKVHADASPEAYFFASTLAEGKFPESRARLFSRAYGMDIIETFTDPKTGKPGYVLRVKGSDFSKKLAQNIQSGLASPGY